MIPFVVLLTQVTGEEAAPLGRVFGTAGRQAAGQVFRHAPEIGSRTIGTVAKSAPKYEPGMVNDWMKPKDGISKKLRDAWENGLGTEAQGYGRGHESAVGQW